MATALVLISAFLHALWNALLRREEDRDRTLVVCIGVATVLATAVAGVRWGLGELPFATLASVAWAIGAGIVELIYFMTLARALDAGPLGSVYTISRGGAVVVIWPIAIAAFGERVTAVSAIGTLVVLGGLALSGVGLPSGAPRAAARAMWWSIACAVSIAGYHLAYKGALAAGGSPSAVFALALAVTTAANAARLGREGRRIAAAIARAHAARVVFMGVVCGGAFLMLIEGLASGGAGYALTLRNTSVLFAVGMSWWIGEPPGRAQIAGAIFVAAGAVLMAW